ncbi:MAG: T9SS type A sorting domain-containing protein [Ignavibacteriae bacterium]|nr:T9SS type A sorting domain-containing protein [Ignavibacteriota bacterium]
MKKIKLLFLIPVLIWIMVFCESGFSQWTISGSIPLTGTLWPSVSVVNANVAWIAGGVSTPMVFRTINGGVNWTTIPVSGLPVKALMCIWGIDSLTAYVGDGGDAAGTTGGDASISKTTNGGLNWTTIFHTGGTAGFFNGLIFSRKTPSFGFAESDPQGGAGTAYYVQKTTNGGANWTLTNPPGLVGESSAQNSLIAIDNQFYGYGLNATARAYLTSNGGTNWYTGTLGITGTFTAALAFNDNKLNGIAATSTSHPNIARTTNGGTTWSSVSVGGSGTSTLASMKWIQNSNTCYYVATMTSAAGIYRSTNSGLNWSVMTAPAGQTGYSHFDFALTGNTVTGFAIGASGIVLKLSETVTLTPSEGNIIPAEYKLAQNYPNPFNPVTKIGYSIPKSGYVTISVHDILGKEVAVIVNEYKNAGSFTVEFDAVKLTSGVYFYKIISGNFSDTKKMMVLK